MASCMMSQPRIPLLTCSLITVIAACFPVWAQSTSDRVEIRGKDIYVGNQQFLIKGIHYSPWRPGTGPNKGYPYPAPAAVEADLQLIRELNVNTILAFDPPDYVLDLAHKHGLKVLYTFTINWWAVGSVADASARESILKRVTRYQQKPAVLAWVLGNEIPSSAIEQRGAEPIRNGLRELYESVKALDSRHPITHSNWPVTKDLDLGFFDITSFNLYPLWPPEVVAMGYGSYIKQVLQPIAAEKPLLVTEFGVNTIEAKEDGQARLLKSCWESIQEAGVAGGVVFEFADEWWKNYDNPKREGNWWDRQTASEDEKNGDQDPEEHYGIVTADRKPKAAFSTVREMFATPTRQHARTIPAVIISSFSLLAAGAWLWAKRTSDSGRKRQGTSGF